MLISLLHCLHHCNQRSKIACEPGELASAASVSVDHRSSRRFSAERTVVKTTLYASHCSAACQNFVLLTLYSVCYSEMSWIMPALLNSCSSCLLSTLHHRTACDLPWSSGTRSCNQNSQHVEQHTWLHMPSFRPAPERSRDRSEHSPLCGPVHCSVRKQHRDSPPQYLISRSTEGVEDGRVKSSS